jgi:hypothetical protein
MVKRERVVTRKYDKGVVTPEMVEEIKKQNKEKLDWILEQGPEYIIELAKKEYGDGWMVIFSGENHYLHYDRLLENRKNPNKKYKQRRGNRDRPVRKVDRFNKKVLETYSCAEDLMEKEQFTLTQLSTALSVCTGKLDLYRGFIWQFDDTPLNQE